MTEKLFLLNTFQFECAAKVLADDDSISVHQDKCVVLLDRTVFHPQGGGQPADRGQIVCSAKNAIFEVEDVRMFDGTVAHFGVWHDAQLKFVAGDSVQCSIDERWRRECARAHSGGHLIDIAMAAVGKKLPPVKCCHFPQQEMYVGYSGKVDDPTALQQQLTVEVKRLIENNVDVQVKQSVTPDDCESLGVEPVGDETRVVQIGNYDGCACGGTHVNATGQLDGLRIDNVRSRKGKTTVFYSFVNPIDG